MIAGRQFLGQHPMEKLPLHPGQVGAWTGSLKESPRKTLSVAVILAFKQYVFQASERLRNAQLGLICSMIRSVNRTSYGTPFAAFPILAVHNFICLLVRLEPHQVFALHLRVAMKCGQH